MIPGGRTIPFVKASAAATTFLLIDAALAPSDIADFTRRICDRHKAWALTASNGCRRIFPLMWKSV